ncbi:MAG TPA: hypothetical protein VJ747_14645 [Stellaceae bacterium]|nr:hypothetical protein [Stellaceae bacterium]
MILGLSTSLFTLVHVALSLIGIFSGLFVLIGMLAAQRRPSWTALFLLSTIATSVSGFFFPSDNFGPAHIVGVLSLVVLVIALVTRYGRRLAGAARWIYVLAALLALYLNVFVGIVQAFQKLAFLQALAPTQSEPPFVYTQLVVLAIFVVLAVIAMIRFRPAPPQRPAAMDIRRAGA